MSNEEPAIKISWFRDLAPIAMLLISGLVWGMKLEARYDKLETENSYLRSEVSSLQSTINKGILPITEEKIYALTSRVITLEKDCLERK